MGFLDQARKRINHEVDEDFMALINSLKKDDIGMANTLMDDFLAPKEFWSVIGNLHTNTLAWVKAGIDTDVLIANFMRASSACDKFFGDMAFVKCWVIAKAYMEAGVRDDEIQEILGEKLRLLREDNHWQQVALSFYIANKIDSRLGPCSCTREVFWEEQKKAAGFELRRVIDTLSRESIHHYRALPIDN